ncbi:unnamed protein product, partial [Prorocentrum cordatum]
YIIVAITLFADAARAARAARQPARGPPFGRAGDARCSGPLSLSTAPRGQLRRGKLKGTPAASSCPAAWPGAPRRELPDQHLHQRGPGGAVNQGGERPRSPSTGIAALSPHAGEHRWRAWTPEDLAGEVFLLWWEVERTSHRGN